MPRDGIPNLTYNSQTNQITTAGYQYDVAGNLTRSLADDGVTWLKYTYDAANRLQLVQQDDGTNLEAYQFGASNERLLKYDYLANQTTVYAGNLMEYTEYTSAVMVWTKSNLYLGDSLFSTVTPNGSNGEVVEYHHPDRLGTRLITNQQAGTSYEQTTLPFGTALNAETSGTTSKRFTSYERSARTGLDYAVNRTYDSKLGRFTQVDPIGMSAVSLFAPQTLNLYNYCGNDPINHTDPNGLFWGFFKKLFRFVLVAVSVIVAVVAIISAVVITAGAAGVVFASGFAAVGAAIGATTGVIGAMIAIATAASAVYNAVGAVSNFADNRKPKKKKRNSSEWCPKGAVDVFYGDKYKRLKIFEEAVKQTEETGRESGGWVYQSKNGRLKAVIKQDGGKGYSIDLNTPPNIAGMRVVGTFHVHPGRSGGIDAYPSGDESLNGNVLTSSADYAVNRGQKVPGLVLARSPIPNSGITGVIYGPERGFFGIGVPEGCPKAKH